MLNHLILHKFLFFYISCVSTSLSFQATLKFGTLFTFFSQRNYWFSGLEFRLTKGHVLNFAITKAKVKLNVFFIKFCMQAEQQ